MRFVFLLSLTFFYLPQLSAQNLLINEVSSENYNYYYDEDFNDPDWIELINADTVPINLKYYRISDKNDFSNAWILPDTVLQAGEIITIYASGQSRNHSESFIVKSSGGGIFSHEFPDSFRFGYIETEGEFDISVRTLSMREENIWANIGLVVRENLSDTARFCAIMNFSDKREVGEYGLVYRQVGDKYPQRKYIDIKNEYPNCYIKLKREDNIIRGSVIDSKGYELSSVTIKDTYPSNVLVGISANSRDQNTLARHAFSDLTINGKKYDFNKLIFYDMNCDIAGSSGYSKEIHTNFKINNDGENLFLWNPQGEILDYLEVPALPANISYGRSDTAKSKLCFFDTPTPNTTNKNQKTSILNKPTVSKQGAWYDNSLTINLGSEVEDAIIYYSLDGREPSNNSAIYTAPINIDSTTVLKAFAAKDGHIRSKTIQQTYMINERLAHSIPTICLSIDPDSLFDSKRGLFTKPSKNREFKVYFEVWDSTGNLLYKTEAGVKNHGHGAAIGLDQKSLRLYARSIHDKKCFDYPFFGKNSLVEYDKIVLRNGGGDWWSCLIRDGLHSKISENISNLDAPFYKPCIVYVNGEYWGIYGIVERVDEELIRDKYKVKKQNIDFLEDQEILMHGNKKDYTDLNNYIIRHKTKDTNFANTIKSNIDLDNYLKYMFVNFFSSNYDWPEHNRKFWKATSDNVKWKWFLYDMDWTANFDYLVTPDNNRFQTIIHNADTSTDINQFRFSKFFKGIMQDTDFRNKFINLAADLMNSTFLPENIMYEIDVLYNQLKTEVPFHQERWEESAPAWEKKIEKLRDYFKQRPTHFREDIIEQFSLADTALLVTNVNNSKYGYLRINSLELKDFPWRGVYFDGVRIEIEAISYPGRRFVKWTDDRFGSAQKITVDPKDIHQLTAIFEKGDDDFAGIVINEIMYKSSEASDSGDWIELYNPGEFSLDLTGCFLTDSNSDNIFNFKPGDHINGKSYLVLIRDKVKFKSIYPNIKYHDIFDFGLSKDDAVKIFTPDLDLLDSVDYNIASPWPTLSYNTGKSIALISPELDNSKGKYWISSEIFGGTPGQGNNIPDSLIETQNIDYLNIFPNPVISFLNLESNVYGAEFQICNIYGTRVIEGSFSLYTIVDCQSLPPGLYTLQVNCESFTKSKVFIVSK